MTKKLKEIYGKLIIRKHSAVIQMSNRITAQQRKAFNALLHLAYLDVGKDTDKYKEFEDKKVIPVFTCELSRVKSLAGLRATDNIKLKEALKKLTSVVIEYNLLKKDKEEWGAFTLLSSISISEGTANFVLPYELFISLLRPRLFAPLDLVILSGLESKYSIAFYELAKDYLGAEIPKMDIDTFRKLLGMEDGQYINFYDLKKWVIDPAINEVNEKTELRITYRTFAEGRKIVAIKLIVTEVSSRKITEDTKASEAATVSKMSVSPNDKSESPFNHFAATRLLYEKYIRPWTEKDTAFYEQDRINLEQISIEAIEAGIIAACLRKMKGEIGSFHYCIGAILEFSESLPSGYLKYLRDKHKKIKNPGKE